MEFLEVMSPTFEKSFKSGNNKTWFIQSKDKVSFKNFLNTALSNNNGEKRINEDEKITESDISTSNIKLDKSKFSTKKEIDKKTIDIKTKADSKKEITQTEEPEIKIDAIEIEELKEIYELLQNLIILNEENILHLLQILKTYEICFENSQEIKDFSNNKSEINLYSNELTQNIIETIKFLKMMSEDFKQNHKTNQFIEMPENTNVKELIKELGKYTKAETLILEEKQKFEFKTNPKMVNLNSKCLVVDYETEKIVADNRNDIIENLPEVEESVEVTSERPNKLFSIEIEKNNKGPDLKDIEQNLTILNEKINENSTKIQKFESIIKQERVPKSNVMEQIIQKIKFVSKEDFSEFRIQLKPENLGKLMLKIVLDKGQMTARFTAENSRVKEIIESNISELKGSLQEKGINVQNLSVSVGNDERWYNDKNGQWKNSAKQSNSKKCDTKEVAFDVENINPYSITEGTLDIKV